MKSDEFRRNGPLRIGLFGGTFNPLHQGHLQAARDVLQHLDLHCIYFIPSAEPPHKDKRELASTADRLAMVQLALADHPRLKACDAEIRREGPSFSFDTVRQIKSNAPGDAQFHFILGLDAFLEIHTWHRFADLSMETAFAVMSRPGSGLWSAAMCRNVEAYVKQYIANGYRLSDTGHLLRHPRRPDIHLVSVTPVDIASSRIRRMIRGGESITHWVAPPVARYIEERGLYQ